MAGLLYTYAVTSIRAAKRNAKLHREADGGQLDMRKESLRRHGFLEPVQGTSDIDLFRNAKAQDARESQYLTDKQAKPLGSLEKEEGRTPRTENEGLLEGLRSRDALKKLKEELPKH